VRHRAATAWNPGDLAPIPDAALPALLHLFRGEEGKLILSVLLFLVKSSPVWSFPIVTAAIIDATSGGLAGATPRILGLACLQLVLLLQNIPTHTVFARLLNGSVRRMEARLRLGIVRKLQQLSFAFLDGSRSGALQTKILRDAEALGILSQQIFGQVLSGLTHLVIPLAVTLYKDPRIALLFALVLPLPLVLVGAFHRRIGENAKLYRRDLEGMNARLAESLAMLSLVRAHGAEERELELVSEKVERVADSGRRLDVFNGIFGSTSWVVFQVTSLGCLVFTALLALGGSVTVGEIILYNGFFVSILGSVTGLAGALPDFARGLESLASLREVLNAPESEDDAGKLEVGEIAGAFSFEAIHFGYPKGSGEVLSGLSFEAAAGSRIAVVGESGSGKSTLMGLITGVLAPSSGRILLDGRDLRSLRLRDYRTRLSLVSQQVLLFSGSVRDNLCYGLEDVTTSRIEEALEAARALEFVRALPQGLETGLGELGGRLSGGQRQRLAIARALIRDPRVLILDEATSALDAENERLVQEALGRLMAGRTTFIVAHRLSTVRNANLIVVLKKGRVAETGSWDSLVRRDGDFARMAGLSGQPAPFGLDPYQTVEGA
jgi:ATP-binding cassette subfamily B protein